MRITVDGVPCLRSPDSNFDDLTDFPFEPR